MELLGNIILTLVVFGGFFAFIFLILGTIVAGVVDLIKGKFFYTKKVLKFGCIGLTFVVIMFAVLRFTEAFFGIEFFTPFEQVD